MHISERRAEILKILRQASTPVAAKDLAARFSVSRQVIVQDLAVIRASTGGILSTNRGYILQQDNTHSREFKVCHTGEQVQHELELIVDCGGHIKNVSISHRVYGRLTAELDIASRQDVREFTETLINSKSSFLGGVTSGYHYHLVEAPSEERLDLIQRELEKAGYLVPLLPWEQQGEN